MMKVLAVHVGRIKEVLLLKMFETITQSTSDKHADVIQTGRG